MTYKTRSGREFTLETLNLRSKNEAELKDICLRLYEFAFTNTQMITPDYLMKRLISYSILTMAVSNGRIVGFGFADDRQIKTHIPLIHFGLMIVHKDWRGDRLSRRLTTSIVRFVTKKRGLKIYLTGFAISAKCSSPVSFYRLQQGSFKLGFPKFDEAGNLNKLSRSSVGRILSGSIADALGLGEIDDFVIQDSNLSSGFKLAEENYVTNSAYEKKVLNFFEKNVIPKNEVLFISYAHPIMAL